LALSMMACMRDFPGWKQTAGSVPEGFGGGNMA